MKKSGLIVCTLLMCSSLLLSGCSGCDKKQPNENLNGVPTSGPMIDDNSDNSEINNDFSSITDTTEENKDFNIVIDPNQEDIVKNYDVTTLSFDEWNFKISVPKRICNDYTKLSSLDSFIKSEEDMEKAFAYETDGIFQLFQLNDCYFGVFDVSEKLTKEYYQAVISKDSQYILKQFENSSLIKPMDTNVAFSTIDKKNLFCTVYSKIDLVGDEYFAYDGYVGILITNNHMYYIVFGENNINFEIDNSYHGYTGFIFNTIEIINNDFTDNYLNQVDTSKPLDEMSMEEYAAYCVEEYGMSCPEFELNLPTVTMSPDFNIGLD